MKRFIRLILFLIPLFAISQEEDDYIKWQDDRKLTWEDFQATPLKLGSTAALTTSHLGFSYSMTNGKMKYSIECRFQKSRSWGLVKNDWILMHEQGHFDIAEIFARKLNKQISSYTFNSKTFQKDLDEIYQTIMNEKDKFQQLYDNESDYSRNKPKQEEWVKKIAAELEQLKAWANY